MVSDWLNIKACAINHGTRLQTKERRRKVPEMKTCRQKALRSERVLAYKHGVKGVCVCPVPIPSFSREQPFLTPHLGKSFSIARLGSVN